MRRDTDNYRSKNAAYMRLYRQHYATSQDYMQLRPEHLEALADCRDGTVEFPAAFEDSIYRELVAGGFIIYQQHLSDPDTAYFELTPTGRAILALVGPVERSETDED